MTTHQKMVARERDRDLWVDRWDYPAAMVSLQRTLDAADEADEADGYAGHRLPDVPADLPTAAPALSAGGWNNTVAGTWAVSTAGRGWWQGDYWSSHDWWHVTTHQKMVALARDHDLWVARWESPAAMVSLQRTLDTADEADEADGYTGHRLPDVPADLPTAAPALSVSDTHRTRV
jgi:hypothetical protein